MTKEEIIERLKFAGWLIWPEGLPVPDVALEVAKAAYINFHRIKPEELEDHLQLPRCSLPDTLQVTEAISRWGKKNLSWTIINDLPSLPREQFKAAITEALSRISKVCGVTHQWTDDASSADIIVRVRKIDGPSGVLAEAMLPGEGTTRALSQWYDQGERWALVLTGDPGNSGIDLYRVAAHELCHNHGVGHLPGSSDLMNPTYSRRIWQPQAGDIRELVARYGPPVSQPTPIPTPTPIPGGGSMSPVFIAILKALLPQLLPYLIKIIEDWLNKQSSVLDQWRQGQLSTPQLVQALKASAEADVQALTAQP